MNNDQLAFETKYFQRYRHAFRNVSGKTDNEYLVQIFKKLIIEKNYPLIIDKIKSLHDFALNSISIEAMKMDWWKDYFAGNLQKKASGKVILTDFESKLKEYDSIEEIYEQFIKPKNEIIWKPYESIFTKIFTEWCVEAIVEGIKSINIRERIDFIKQSVLLIEKEQAFESYTKFQLNEHLNYYKKVLELAL